MDDKSQRAISTFSHLKVLNYAVMGLTINTKYVTMTSRIVGRLKLGVIYIILRLYTNLMSFYRLLSAICLKRRTKFIFCLDRDSKRVSFPV